jgi:hypothetical protein
VQSSKVMHRRELLRSACLMEPPCRDHSMTGLASGSPRLGRVKGIEPLIFSLEGPRRSYKINVCSDKTVWLGGT